MKLLGSVRFITPEIVTALEIAKRMKENKSYEEHGDEVETNIMRLSQAKFEYEIFKTHNAYSTLIGGRRFEYHDEVKLDLITIGKIQIKLKRK